ncbi:hypothetical protein ACQR1W_21565 [Bradyrhizobium sp. HKCCYLS1011]|uniref:hypothetical protein n=1 Tax=Bradyrhizobium sp. HKCCYLS1011 TaxID=3420733 RepID=UPI003EBE44F3
MKLQFAHTLASIAAVSQTNLAAPARADETISKSQADAFDVRVFAKPPGRKAYACFMRHYDADHLARHPKQKVAAMQLLITAEIADRDSALAYSFRLGINDRDRPGDFDSSGACDHALAENAHHEIRDSCPMDCEGGGIEVALSKDDKSAIVRLARITMWQRDNKPDTAKPDIAKPNSEASDALVAGSDDKIFLLDRTDPSDCAGLVTDRKELAALRHK